MWVSVGTHLHLRHGAGVRVPMAVKDLFGQMPIWDSAIPGKTHGRTIMPKVAGAARSRMPDQDGPGTLGKAPDQDGPATSGRRSTTDVNGE